MFGNILLFAFLIYIAVCYVFMKVKSAVAVLMIYKDAELIDVVPFYARDFGWGIREAREKQGMSRMNLSVLSGLSWMDVFLMEHGYKISPKAFLNFLMASKEVREWCGIYQLTEGSEFIDWCDKNCDDAALIGIEDVQKKIKCSYERSIPEVLVNDLSFNEYIFKGEPMIYICTSIMDVKIEEIPQEDFCEEKLSD